MYDGLTLTTVVLFVTLEGAFFLSAQRAGNHIIRTLAALSLAYKFAQWPLAVVQQKIPEAPSFGSVSNYKSMAGPVSLNPPC